MTEQLISLQLLLSWRERIPIIDARSEGEFAQGHIYGAYNLPILTNQERKTVGTIYKEQGSDQAVLAGFEIVGPRFHLIQKEAINLVPDKKVILYCWRGGMRSQILSWLLGMVGFEVYRLDGGYKNYRTFTLELIRRDWKLMVLGGKTGTGKTLLLSKLKERGEQVIDLEGIARHKGSTFGAIGQGIQPSVEQFENHIAEQLLKFDPIHPIWVENESRKIGRVIIPDIFFSMMGRSPMIDIQKTDLERIRHIESEYASLPQTDLIQAVTRIAKRLGGLRTKQAIKAIEEKRHWDWISNVLLYYDKAYHFGLTSRPKDTISVLEFSQKPLQEQIDALIACKNKIYGNPY